MERGTVNPKVVGSSPTIGVIQLQSQLGEYMVSEIVLGILFCFLLPLAVGARFWNWYAFFKRREQLKIERQKVDSNDQP